jgi:DNA-directed RNA polymerase subunit RPC12/RpoP
MSEGLCPSCGAAVNLGAEQEEINCTYCATLVKRREAEAQFAEVKNSKFGGTLLIAETAQEGGSYEEALNYYNKIIEQQPDIADAWFNKGTCMVHTSTIGKLKIPEAISSWKTAIKFAKNPEAMKKRVAMETAQTVVKFYPVLTSHYMKFAGFSDYHRGTSIIISALVFAQEIDPKSEFVAKTGISVCEIFSKTITEILFKKGVTDEYTAMCDDNGKFKGSFDSQADNFLKVLEKENPQSANALKAQRESHSMKEKEGKSGCFVATACYGNYDHPIVIELRQFRDIFLESSRAGRRFVRWYYKSSPLIANFVAKNGILKILARILIVAPVVTIARIITKINNDNY